MTFLFSNILLLSEEIRNLLIILNFLELCCIFKFFLDFPHALKHSCFSTIRSGGDADT